MFNVAASNKTTSTTHKQTERFAGHEFYDWTRWVKTFALVQPSLLCLTMETVTTSGGKSNHREQKEHVYQQSGHQTDFW